MRHGAIYALYPSVVTIDETAGCFDIDGNKVEIDKEAVDAWIDKDAYKMSRAREYPDIGDQLDMLWHSIDKGTLDKNSDFYQTLKNVKDKYPK